MKSRTLLIVLTIVVAVSAGAQSLDGANEAAVRSAVEAYYAAYGGGTAERVLASWAAASPDRAAAEKRLKSQFDAYHGIHAGRVEIVEMTVSGPDLVHVRVNAALTGIDNKSAASVPLGSPHRNLDLVLENGAWRVARDASAEEDLGDALVSLKTRSERDALIAAHPDLVTIDLRKALQRRANKIRNEGGYETSIALYELMIDVSEKVGDLEGVGLGWIFIGFAHRAHGENEKALAAFEKSIPVREKAGDRSGLANSITQVASIYFAQGDYDRAMAEYQKALPIAEQSGHKGVLGVTVGGIGDVQARRGDFVAAMAAYERALHLAEEAGDQYGRAAALENIGETYMNEGDYDGAIKSFRTVLDFADTLTEKITVRISMLSDIASVSLLRGNFAEAMQAYEEVLRQNETLGDLTLQVSVLNDMAQIHQQQGNYDAAARLLRRAIELDEQHGNKVSMAQSLIVLGETYAAERKAALAIDAFRRAKTVLDAAGDKPLLVDVTTGLASVYRDRNDRATALRLFNDALARSEAIGDKSRIIQALDGIAETRLGERDFAAALVAARRASGIAQPIGHRELWRSKTLEGEALRGLGRRDEARQVFDSAINAVEGLRAQIAGGEQDEERFFEGRVRPYRAMIELLAGQGDFAGALQYAERAKARVLLDTLERGRIDVTRTMTTDEKAQERSVRTRLVSANRMLEVEKVRPQSDAGRLAAAESEVVQARAAFEGFREQLYGSHPDLRVKRADIAPLTRDELAAIVADDRSALLEYVLTNAKSYLLVATHDGRLRGYDLHVSPAALRKKVSAFRDRIAQRDLDYREAARELYDILIGPARLKDETSLVVVPDGVLWDLPFQALVGSSRRFMAEEYAISYAPSATTLREMMRRGTRAGSDRPRTLLAFGNPLLSNKTVERAKSVVMGEALDPLPEAERQVQELAKYYGSQRSRIYVGAEAREDRLKAEARDFRILQLATHGILNDASPMYSHVVLAPSKREGEEDGLLEAWEMMNLDLDADLVVLSACDTARGRIGAGEGVIGMSWALFVAGVPSLVVSQWQVDSASTTDLMLGFHRHLQGGSSKARALQLASVELLKNPRYRHPFYWAGFVVVGDAR